jgi:cold shock CspA family protein
VAPLAPPAELLPFGRGDLLANAAPRPGDAVEFSLVTDRRTGVRRASRIALLRRSGVVVSVKPAYGFVECVPEAGDAAAAPGARAARVFYHASEVEGAVPLRERDEVDFCVCVNAKTGEPNARKVRRTREAPPPQQRPERPEREEAPVRQEREKAPVRANARK